MDTGEFSDEDKLAHFELTQEIRQKLQGGVTTEQAAADLGLSRDQLSLSLIHI